MADVTVRYWAGARAAAGRDDERLTAGSTDELVRALSVRAELARVLSVSSLLVDGRVVHGDVPLADGQVVEVLPPFAGG